MTVTDEQYEADSAAETVVMGFNPETKRPDFIAILDETGEIAVSTSDKHFARALAVRLVELSAELPDPPRILRRSSDIDDRLRGLEP